MKKLIKRWRTKRLLAKIEKADEDQLGEIIRYILDLYKKRYPETECAFLSLPRNDWAERKRTLESVSAILMSEEFTPDWNSVSYKRRPHDIARRFAPRKDRVC